MYHIEISGWVQDDVDPECQVYKVWDDFIFQHVEDAIAFLYNANWKYNKTDDNFYNDDDYHAYVIEDVSTKPRRLEVSTTPNSCDYWSKKVYKSGF